MDKWLGLCNFCEVFEMHIQWVFAAFISAEQAVKELILHA